MTGRTHDLAAFTALTFIVATEPLPDITLPTALVSLSAIFLGGLAPDIDQSTAKFWQRMPAGTVFGKLISPMFGGHRFISHSIIGVFIFGLISSLILDFLGTFVMVDLDIVWNVFMIGFISHLLMDALTREGIPIFFPIPFKIGFPPLGFLRMKTGGFLEKSFVFPLLLLLNVYIFYSYYPRFVEFLRNVLN